MIKIILYLLSACFITLAATQPTLAQSPTPMEMRFLEKIQSRHPDFRIVKRVEPFPARYNATIELPIRVSSRDKKNTARALVTLHDGKTGQPLESCFSPCSLHKSQGSHAFLFAYKQNYLPLPMPLPFHPSDWYDENPYWDGFFDMDLGLDHRDFYKQIRNCRAKIAKMDTSEDKDAVPCYRVPPVYKPQDRSGLCELTFDVSPKGYVENIKSTCSHPMFETPSRTAVQRWVYMPKIDRGMAVTRTNVETKLRFDVIGYDGALLDKNGEPVKE